MKILKIIIFFVLGFQTSTSFAQTSEGKEFWVTPSLQTYPDSFFVILSASKPSTVTVSIPKTTFTTTVNLGYNDLIKVYIPNTYKPNTYNNFNNFAIKVVATNPIFCYSLSAADFTTDASFCFPSEAIPNGVSYRVASPSLRGVKNILCIISLNNNNVINITPNVDTDDGQLKGIKSSITLNEGECYTITAAEDLFGSLIESEIGKKIVLTSGDQCGVIRCTACDHIYEAVPPTSTLGKNYIVTPFYGQTNGYDFQIIAHVNNTIIKVNNTIVATLNAGQEYYRSVKGDSGFCINSNKEIMAIQYMTGKSCQPSKYGGDPAMLILNSLEQSIVKAVVTTSNTPIIKSHFINIVTTSLGKDSVYLDGSLIPASSFKSVGCGGYYLYSDTINTGNHRISCYDGIISYLYGIGLYESYAYSAGSNLKNLKRTIESKTYAGCDTGFVTSLTSVGDSATNFIWTFNNTDTSTKRTPSFYVKKAGEYPVKLKFKLFATGLWDSTKSTVLITNPLNVELIPFDSLNVCDVSTTIFLPNVPIFKYNWNTGDTTPILKITKAGKYKVTLTNTLTGCTKVDSCEVNIFSKIKANFSLSMTKNCPDFPLYLNDTSNLNGQTLSKRFWYTDNIYRSLKKQDTFAITAASDYNVKLVIHTTNGCKDSLTKIFLVSSKPKARAAIKPIDSCYKNNLFRFYSASTTDFGVISGYKWLFSNGTTSSLQLPRLSFKDSGKYSVKLIAYSGSGCNDTTKPINFKVYSVPFNNAIVSDSGVCLKNNFYTFKNPNINPKYSYIWDWGNGTGSTEDNPGKTSFLDTGVFLTKFITVDILTQCKDTSFRKIQIYPNVNLKLSVDSFNYCLNKNFYASKVTLNSPVNKTGTLNWSWGDLTSNSTQTPINNFKKVYASNGSFRIRVTHSLGSGCYDTAFKNVIVYNSPTAKINVTDSNVCGKNNYYTLKNSSIAANNARWLWLIDSFNANTNKETGKIVFPKQGTYIARLTVLEPLTGCKDSISKSITIFKSLVIKIGITDSILCQKADSITLTDLTNYGNLDATSNWYWKNGSQIGNTKIVKTIGLFGKNILVLKGGKVGVCIDSTTQTVFVKYANNPVSISKKVVYACSPAIASFIATSNLNQDFKYNWNFNSTSFNGNSVSNLTTSSLNSIPLFLTATDSTNCVFKMQDSLKAEIAPKIAILNSTPNIQCFNYNNFNLTSGVNGNIQGIYTWKLNDIVTDSNNFKNFSIKTPKTVTIKIHFSSILGCTDSSDIKLTVLPKTEIRIVSDTQCLGVNKTLYLNNSSSLTDQYTWQFSNGMLKSGTSVAFDFNTLGSVSCQVFSSNASNCLDSSNIANLFTREPPKASFTYNTLNPLSNGVPIVLNNNSFGNPISYNWFINAENVGTSKNLNLIIKKLGLNTIVLKVKDTFGCIDTASLQTNINSTELMYVPTAFSPNSNNLNEIFKPAYLSAVKEFSMDIYNRWGQLLFNTTNAEKGWDGTYLNNPVLDGVYVYKITCVFITNQIYTLNGNVTVFH